MSVGHHGRFRTEVSFCVSVAREKLKVLLVVKQAGQGLWRTALSGNAGISSAGVCNEASSSTSQDSDLESRKTLRRLAMSSILSPQYVLVSLTFVVLIASCAIEGMVIVLSWWAKQHQTFLITLRIYTLLRVPYSRLTHCIRNMCGTADEKVAFCRGRKVTWQCRDEVISTKTLQTRLLLDEICVNLNCVIASNYLNSKYDSNNTSFSILMHRPVSCLLFAFFQTGGACGLNKFHG